MPTRQRDTAAMIALLRFFPTGGIERALRFTRGNRRKAIELLRVSPETFYRRLEEFGIKKKNEE